MINRFAGSIRRVAARRAALDSYLGNVLKTKCACGPKYEEALKDYNGRIRDQFRGFIA